MDSEKIVRQWLADLAYSADTWDLDAHMALISEKVVVMGISGAGTIDYRGWRIRRRNEFSQKLLHGLSYSHIRVLSERPEFITFYARERMRDQNHLHINVDKEVTLHREQDGRWRVVREQILEINVHHPLPRGA